MLSNEEMYCPSEYIQRENINLWFSVPALASFMNQLGALEENAFPSLKRSLFCGEALTKSLAKTWMRAAPNSTVENLYGPTETTISITRKLVTESDTEQVEKTHFVAIGDIFENHTLALIDSDNAQVQKGETGEIILKGPQLAEEYLNNEEKTHTSFVQMPWDDSCTNRWYKTGDLARFDSSGELIYVGRADNQIKLSGRRMELGEIEHCLVVKGKLDPVVVVPVTNEEGITTHLVAFTTRVLEKEDLSELSSRCLDHLESIFYPKAFYTLDKFPSNYSGKVDRKKLLEQILK